MRARLRSAIACTFAVLAVGLTSCGSSSGKDRVATPTFSPEARTFGPGFDVDIACGTPEAVVHYTTDGTDPSADSTEYGAPIRVVATVTIRAVAIKRGMQDSAVAEVTYTLDPSMRETVAAPTFSRPSSIYGVSFPVTLQSATPGASFFYTVDGSPATSASIPYTGPITIQDATTTVHAVATHADMNDSPASSATYTFAPVELRWDDGSVSSGVGSSLDHIVILSRYTPSARDFPFTLRRIEVRFQRATTMSVGSIVGLPVELLVYTDDDADNSNGATLVAQVETSVLAQDDWSVYDLPTPVTLTGPGDVLIGIGQKAKSGLAVSYCSSSSSSSCPSGHSWFGSWNDAESYPAFPPDELFPLDRFLPGSFLIRGYN